MPLAGVMPSMSSGDVSARTRIDLLALRGHRDGLLGGERGRPARGAGRRGRGPCAIAVGFFALVGSKIGWSSWLSCVGVDAEDRLLLRDQLLLHHLDGDPDGGVAGALAVPGLEHVQLPVLDGELEVLHVAVVLLQAPW